MNKLLFLLVLGACFLRCGGLEPFTADSGMAPFTVYFESRYRGICVGTMVSRMAVLTAAVCVTSTKTTEYDTRAINVVAGTMYRHPRRGIRVQVIKVVLPILPNVTGDRAYLLQKSPALLILKHKVPDILAEVPVRALAIDWKAEDKLSMQDECVMLGWHYFYKGDKIFPVHKFLLQKKLRVQYLNIVKKHLYCDPLSLKFMSAMDNMGFSGMYNKKDGMCVRDTDRTAQPCHGMYGSPLICKSGRAVGILLAPDAQWTNCTGFSNIVHLFTNQITRVFLECISNLFMPEVRLDWRLLKETISLSMGAGTKFDYTQDIYDKILGGDSSSSMSEDD